MKVTYPVTQLTFIQLFKLMINYYKKMIIGFVLLTLLPLLVDTSWIMMRYIFKFHVIFFGGLMLSFVIHEYLHLFCLKNSKKTGNVEIEFTLFKISIHPKFQLTSKEIIKVALLPIIILPLIGFLLIFLATLTNQKFLMFTGYLYVFHIINIIPPLGDGMMILKAIFDKPSSLERR